MKAESPLVTIIVPAYNVEKYIAECLDSLVNQTHINHKVIVVNDGSLDETEGIVRRYAEKFPDMIMLVSQENNGQGSARNNGLSYVETPFVTFLDSDDWMECRFVEKLEIALTEHDEKPDIIFTLPWCYDNSMHNVYEWRDKPLIEELFYPHGAHEDVLSYEITKTDSNWMRMYSLEASACRRIFRTNFLKKINFKFPVGVKWEDVWPHFYSIHCAQRCIALLGTGFVYRTNTSSQTTSGGGATRLDIVPVYSQVLQEAQKNSWSREELAYIIDMFRDFAAWSVRVTNMDYIHALLKDLHKAFRKIPKSQLKDICVVCKRPKFDLYYIYFLRSPFYYILADYRKRTKYKKPYAKLKKLLKRG